MTSTESIAVGLIGFGTGASIFHAPLLEDNPAFRITHVLERSSNKSQSVLPHATIVRSLQELVESSVDLIVVATPTQLHFEQAKAALEHGKHVVVEKPFTLTSEQGVELAQLAKAKNRVLTVFHNRRWDNDFLTVRDIIKRKLLGELTKVEIHFDRYRPHLKDYWKEKDVPGSGILFDLGSHLIDQALQLFGFPDEVCSDIQRQREGSVTDDYFKILLKYSSHPNLKVVLTAGMMVKDPSLKYVLEGSQGTFRKCGTDVQESQLRDGKRPSMLKNEWGVDAKDKWGELNVTLKDESASDRGCGLHIEGKVETLQGTYQEFYANVADVLRRRETSEEEIIVKAQEAKDVIRIIEMAMHNNIPNSLDSLQ